jgi:hypothetical protein
MLVRVGVEARERAGLVDEAFSLLRSSVHFHVHVQSRAWACCGSLFIYSECEFFSYMWETYLLLTVRVSAGN